MFYDNTEPDFPNWWDTIETDAEGDEDGEGEKSLSVDALNTGRDPRARAVAEQSAKVAYETARGYEREVVNRIWEFAEAVPGNDSDLWRKDEWGNWIYRLDYGRRESEFGWEIFDPGVGRHTQGVYAMRPMQWESFIRRYEALG